MNVDSKLMTLAKVLGMRKVAWSLRRLYCPVPKEALVLEVGSGGNPYSRSNVLLDAYEHTRERHWAPLIADRPTVLGFAENLPFKDKSFDFVIASHVLEHSSDPQRFLSELQRVAKAGYIETPDAFMERVNPYKDHRLEVTVRDGRLVIKKKTAWQQDAELVELYENKAKKWVTSETIPNHPFDFHVRYYWQNAIEFEVLNPEVDSAWQAPINEGAIVRNTSLKKGFRQSIRNILRTLQSQTYRNGALEVNSLLRCPKCFHNHLIKNSNKLVCSGCNQVYEVKNNVPILMI